MSLREWDSVAKHKTWETEYLLLRYKYTNMSIEVTLTRNAACFFTRQSSEQLTVASLT